MLNLHSGGEEVSYDQLKQVVTPERTASHVPLAHHELVAMVKYALGYYGHTVEEEHHAIDGENGARYFGLLTLKSDYGSWTDTVGLRNSHDMKFPIGIAMGNSVFVCSNLSFYGSHLIRRKHTSNSRRDLPGLVAEIIEPLKQQRLAQHQKLLTYQHTPINDAVADQAIMQMYRRNVLSVRRIPEVVKEWETPTHDHGEKSVYRLFNAATYVLRGRAIENPAATGQLHNILDGICTVH